MKLWRHWRLNVSPTARTLIATVTLCGLATIVAVVILLNSSLSAIAAKSDEMDGRRTNDTAEAAAQALLSHMTQKVTDNAQWDDAAETAYRQKLDFAWLQRNWGVTALDSRTYDGVFLVDENRRVLWGRLRGEAYTGSDSRAFGSGFAALVATHSKPLNSGETAVSGFSLTRFGPAIVSIALVRPAEHPLTGVGPVRRYLVLTRHFTPGLVQGLGAAFRLDKLRLTAAADRHLPFLNLVGADGRIVAHLTWKPHLSGAAAAHAAAPRIQQITWLISALVVIFVAVSGYALHRLAQSEATARRFSQIDNLSGLPNRRALFEHLQAEGKMHKARMQTVVFIDLDGFKDVNDIYGHNTGDKLIMIVAAALKQYLPEKGMLARMGGDEFALLMAGHDGPAKAMRFAEEALAFVGAPIRIGDRSVQIGASIGIATSTLKACTSHELFRRADLAMYHSKATGKGRITHYDAALDTARQHKQSVEQGIRKGLQNGEFDVVYQPIVEARSQRIVSVEALVRWPGRPEGPLSPDQFIDIAETSGLIHEIGQFVLRKACADLKAVPGIRLSVNISPAQFRDPEFERKVDAVLAETGFPVDRLELEVTEGYLIENPERAIAAVATLKARGVSFALDDFGTGYSSIGYLRRFAFDRIKIDKSLAGLIDRDP
ncbi:MAG: EAL domain-containing protein, partial [Asticcacaulis sp.]|nr:EAL domain-containing protein [Asticcacaulis sp.]